MSARLELRESFEDPTDWQNEEPCHYHENDMSNDHVEVPLVSEVTPIRDYWRYRRFWCFHIPTAMAVSMASTHSFRKCGQGSSVDTDMAEIRCKVKESCEGKDTWEAMRVNK